MGGEKRPNFMLGEVFLFCISDIFFSPESEEHSVDHSYVGIGITNDLEIEVCGQNDFKFRQLQWKTI